MRFFEIHQGYRKNTMATILPTQPDENDLRINVPQTLTIFFLVWYNKTRCIL